MLLVWEQYQQNQTDNFTREIWTLSLPDTCTITISFILRDICENISATFLVLSSIINISKATGNISSAEFNIDAKCICMSDSIILFAVVLIDNIESNILNFWLILSSNIYIICEPIYLYHQWEYMQKGGTLLLSFSNMCASNLCEIST